MGRPARYPREDILAAARTLARGRGMAGVTVTGIAEKLGAPSGSIYHRFPTRDELVAAMWLDTLEPFQAEVIPRLQVEDDPGEGAVAAAGWVVRWAEDHPDAAALLAAHSHQEILTGNHPQELTARATRLRRELEAAFRRLADDLEVEVEAVSLAVAGIPLAALRPYLDQRRSIPTWLAAATEAAARAVLMTRAARR